MIDHSLVEGGQGQIFTDGLQTLQWMASNLTTDPRFANPAGGNYRLLSASPAINAGDSGAIPRGSPATWAAAARVLGGEIDLGATNPACQTSTRTAALTARTCPSSLMHGRKAISGPT